LPKTGYHENVHSGIGKRYPDGENSCKYLSFGEIIVKIDPVDPQIIWLKLKKITEGEISSLVGKFAEQTKNFLQRSRK